MQLNQRFNLHRSDVTLHPEKCELTQHFRDHDCDFETDLEISVLEHFKKSILGKRFLLEDKWIVTMNTLAPNGMNEKLPDFGILHQRLFRGT